MMDSVPTTRASLLLRLRDSQDHASWMEFTALYEPLIYRLLRRSGLQDADARELMQELLLVVSQNIDRWDPDREQGSFRGWLRRVTRNLTINWLKHRDRRTTPSGGAELQSLFGLLPAAEGPESAVFEREYRRALFHRASEQVRGEVSPVTWQAFWETGVVGHSAAQTGQKLGLSAGAVRVAKYRVLARLQAVVTELEAVS